MKKLWWILVLTGLLKGTPAAACSCIDLSFAELVGRADHIFTGQVLQRVDSDTISQYTFRIATVFKGPQQQTATVNVYMRTNCATVFQEKENYVIFSRQGYTDMCLQNERLAVSQSIGQLRYLLESGFAATVGQSNEPLLTENEAIYLRHTINQKPAGFSFAQKRVGYVETDCAITKQAFFQNHAGRAIRAGLIILSEQEKQRFGGFDALIVAYRKRFRANYSRGFRKRAARRVVRLAQAG
jgi:hypothetical protein